MCRNLRGRECFLERDGSDENSQAGSRGEWHRTGAGLEQIAGAETLAKFGCRKDKDAVFDAAALAFKASAEHSLTSALILRDPINLKAWRVRRIIEGGDEVIEKSDLAEQASAREVMGKTRRDLIAFACGKEPNPVVVDLAHRATDNTSQRSFRAALDIYTE